MSVHFLYALLAGVSVVVSSEAARRHGGRLGGVLAAAPVTPTFAILAMDADPTILTQGLPVVAVTSLLVALLLGIRRRVVLLAAPLAFAGPVGWTLITAAAASLTSRQAPIATRPTRGLPWYLRFLLGAGTVYTVAALAAVAPILAPYLALAPWLFVAAISAAALDGGWRGAQHVMRGGAIGAVGICAFAWAAAHGAAILTPAYALVLGWAAYAIVAIAWPTKGFRLRPASVAPRAGRGIAASTSRP